MKAASARAHSAFMALGVLLCAGLIAALISGWRWHNGEVARLARLRQEASTRPPAPAFPVMAVKPVLTKPKPSMGTKRGDVEKRAAAVSLFSALPEGEAGEGTDYEFAAGLPVPDEIQTLPLSENAPELKQALTVLDSYWNARTWQEKMAFVWDAARVGERMKIYYAENEGPEKQRGPLTSAGRYSINGHEIIYLSHDGDRPLGTIEIGLRKTRDGGWKLDWESYTGTGEMSWRAFKTARPTQPVLMRVFAKIGSYHNFEFMDEQRYLPLQLYDEAGESAAHAFCERGTALAAFLMSELGRSDATVKGYTVRLAFPPNAQSNHCVWLKEVVATRWLLDP